MGTDKNDKNQGLDETRPAESAAAPGAAPGATVYAGPQPDEAERRQAEAEVAAEWKPGDVILGLYEVRRVREGFGEDAEERDYHEGGFGRVYKVFHRGWNMELAVKTPRREAFDTEAKKANFLRECEAWSELGLHPHVASCFYVRDLGGVPRIFSEYADAGTLDDWIRYERLYEGEEKAVLARMLDIAIQFAWGLHYAHEQGLVHQDVKPLNLLMMNDGTAKVTDFGMARARALPEGERIEGGSGAMSILVTEAGGMTPAYCSPEQLVGEKLTRRTDLWSWAVSVLAMFQGEVTWESGVLAAQVLEQALQHSGHVEGIPAMPEGLTELLRRCFHRNPDERPHDMREVASELIKVSHIMTGEEYLRPEAKAAPDTPDSLNNRGVSMHDLGKLDEAERLWTEVLDHDRAHLATTYNLGLLQWRQAKVTDDEVVRRLEAVRTGKPTPQSTYLLAMVHAERADFETAVHELERAAAQDSAGVEVQQALRRLIPLRSAGTRPSHILEGHTHWVLSVYIGTDNRSALSGGEDKTLRLWDLITGTCLRSFVGHTGPVYSVCLSADGRFALSGSGDRTIRLWDVPTGNCLRAFIGHTDAVWSVVLSVEGKFLLSGSSDKTLRLWELDTGRCLRVFKGHTELVSSVCPSADGKTFLSGSSDNTLKLWDAATGRCLRTYLGHEYPVTSVCLGADGRLALSGSEDRSHGAGEMRLWEVSTGRCLRSFAGDGGLVWSVWLRADSEVALSGSYDGKLRLWNVATGRCLRTLEGHTMGLNSVRSSADGKLALTGSSDQTLRLWHVELEPRWYAAPELKRPATATKALRSEAVLQARIEQARAALSRRRAGEALSILREARATEEGCRDRRVLEAWQRLACYCRRSALRDAWDVRTFAGHTDAVLSVHLSADGRFGLSGSMDRTMRLWRVETGECLRVFDGHTDMVLSVCLSSNGRVAVSGGRDGSLRLWEASTGRCLNTLSADGCAERSICMSSDDRLLMSGDGEGARLWDVATGECIRFFACPERGATSVCISHDGRLALSGSSDSTMRLWQVDTGKCLRIFEGHTSWVNCVSMSRDGRLALSGGGLHGTDATLRLWEVASGRCVRVFEGHQKAVHSVWLTACGQFALSSSSLDETLRVWEIGTGRCAGIIEDQRRLNCCHLGSGGRFALVGCHDGKLRVWELDWEMEEVVQEEAAGPVRDLEVAGAPVEGGEDAAAGTVKRK